MGDFTLEYTQNEGTGTCYVSSYSGTLAEPFEVFIPAQDPTLSSYVVSIGDDALAGLTDMTSVVFDAPENIVSIGARAFLNTGLTDVTIPSTVTSIGDSAFSNCANLVSADLTGVSATIGGYVFAGDTALLTVSINGSPTIGVGMFSNTGLTSFTFPSTIETIGDGAFAGCANLIEVHYALLPDIVFSNVFAGDSNVHVYIGSPTIYSDMFQEWDGLTEITVENTVNTIEDNAFVGCANLVSADLTGVSAEIGSQVFANDLSLSSVTLSGMTNIGPAMFQNTGLTHVTIPASVTSIGGSAFADCANLSNADLTDVSATIGFNVFANDVSLSSVTLSGMTNIGPGMFYQTGLTRVTIPSSVTSIEANAFSDCAKLSNADLTGVSAEIGSQVFANDVSLSSVTLSGMTNIGESMFNSTGLTRVTIPSSVTSIGANAFSECAKLSNAVLTGVDAEIGDYVFRNDLSLSSVTLSDMTNIGAAMFEYTGLTRVTIPSTVTRISYNAFAHCAKLSNADLTGVSAEIGNNVFYNDLSLASVTLTGMTNIGAAMFQNTGLSGTVTIPSSLTSIADSAFENCLNIRTVVFTNGLTLIGNYMFYDCANLTTANVPLSVTYIGIEWNVGTQISDPSGIADGTIYIPANAFLDRTDLTSITIPGTVIGIGANAFFGCTGLTSMTFPPSLQNIDAGAFQGCTGIRTILFPEAVRSIGNNAFNRVPLNPIRFSGNSAPSMGTHVFDGAATNVFTVKGYRGWPKYIDT